MMSFKAFLATQDDNISDNEAIEKYNDYKLEFQRQQLNEFFVAHKDDEWCVFVDLKLLFSVNNSFRLTNYFLDFVSINGVCRNVRILLETVF